MWSQTLVHVYICGCVPSRCLTVTARDEIYRSVLGTVAYLECVCKTHSCQPPNLKTCKKPPHTILRGGNSMDVFIFFFLLFFLSQKHTYLSSEYVSYNNCLPVQSHPLITIFKCHENFIVMTDNCGLHEKNQNGGMAVSLSATFLHLAADSVDSFLTV